MIFLFIANFSYAQKYYVEDDAFRTCLINHDASAFDATDSLIISNANAVTGVLTCVNQGIQDIEGIQYYESITEIQLDSNQISILPPIDNLVSLERLKLRENNLSTIPPIQTLVALLELDFAYNDITSLPSFSGLSNLHLLNLRENTSLENLPNLNGTDLTSLNLIRTEIKNFPDFNDHLNLNKFYINGIGVHALPDVSMLDLEIFNISNNWLAFEDLLPIVNTPANVDALKFSFLNNFDLEGQDVIQEGDTLVLTFPEDEDITTNTYKWYLDEELYATTSERALKVPNMNADLEGDWQVFVTNSNAYFATNNIELQSQPLKVTMSTCFGNVETEIKHIDEDCDEGIDVEVIHNVNASFGNIYAGLVKENSTDTIFGTGTVVYNQVPANYTLILKDDLNCKQKIGEITIALSSSCDVLITPDGDGINDYFYFELGNTVKVFDSNEQLVRVLYSTGEWDGTNENGEVVRNGYYILIDENEDVRTVTIVH